MQEGKGMKCRVISGAFFLSAPSFRVDTNISHIKRKILTILKYIIDHKIDQKGYKNKIMNIYLRSIFDNIYKIQVIQTLDKKKNETTEIFVIDVGLLVFIA